MDKMSTDTLTSLSVPEPAHAYSADGEKNQGEKVLVRFSLTDRLWNVEIVYAPLLGNPGRLSRDLFY
jgi:hypothetical protein